MSVRRSVVATVVASFDASLCASVRQSVRMSVCPMLFSPFLPLASYVFLDRTFIMATTNMFDPHHYASPRLSHPWLFTRTLLPPSFSRHSSWQQRTCSVLIRIPLVRLTPSSSSFFHQTFIMATTNKFSPHHSSVSPISLLDSLSFIRHSSWRPRTSSVLINA